MGSGVTLRVESESLLGWIGDGGGVPTGASRVL